MTMMDVAANASRRFPRSVLHERQDALLLFGAGLLGANDGYWIAHAGMEGTVVDIDDDKLAEMSNLYPNDWAFVRSDVFEYVEENLASELATFDIVCVDPPMAEISRSLAWLDEYTLLAHHAVLHTIELSDDGMTYATMAVPAGWKTRYVMRNDVVGWLVLERR